MTTTVTSVRELDWTALIETALTVEGSVGNTYNRFHTYSFLNQMLLVMQGVKEPVATYKKWSELGRQVQKGSKSFAINRPITIKKKAEGNEPEKTFLKFKIVNCLFTVSQTEGADLPPFEAPGWDLDAALTALEITKIDYDSTDGNAQGYSTGRTFAINPTAVNQTRTTFHELAHIVLGHTTSAGKDTVPVHRGTAEFQAEATAYLVLNELELIDEKMASHSRGYIQSWLQAHPSDIEIRQVFTATEAILKAGRIS